MTPRLQQTSPCEWVMGRHGHMKTEGVVYGSHDLVMNLEERALSQLADVCSLPGIVGRACCMPDMHQGYGFPIGCVAAFDPAGDGVISAGGVGFDIACGVRTILTDLDVRDLNGRIEDLADALFAAVPSGVGSGGALTLSAGEIDDMLTSGASWAVSQGFGTPSDLSRIEENGREKGARPDHVSQEAKKRQRDQTGSLGAGNHYLEVQSVDNILAPDLADGFGLRPGQVVISLHCGSRGLGHQVASDYLKEMNLQASRHGLELPSKELACAPARSELGRQYLGAMRAAANAALAGRQVMTHLVRQAVWSVLPQAGAMPLLYDVCHNTCKEEEHVLDGEPSRLLVHRKGATRALEPGSPQLPPELRPLGQPVLVGGSMGTSSYVLAGAPGSAARSFSSACHGAGRALSRTAARKRCQGEKVVAELEHQGVILRTGSLKGAAEEAPIAYKNVDKVVEATSLAGLARTVARLRPHICVKG